MADQHANHNLGKFTQSMDEIEEYIKQNPVNLIVSPGDLFDSVVDADTDYHYILNKFANFANYNPLITTRGTPSHDYKGSLNVLREYKTKFPLIVVDESNFIDGAYLYTYKDNTFESVNKIGLNSNFKQLEKGYEQIVVLPLPWPLRSNFLTNEELKFSLVEQEKLFQKKLKNWCDERRIFTKRCPLPVIFISHLQLEGSIPSLKQDLYSDTHKLEMFGGVGDIGLGGHIHKNQALQIGNWRFYYSGNIYNKTWNELENKYFNIVTIEDKHNIKVKRIKLNTPVLIKVDLDGFQEYENFKVEFKNDIVKRYEENTKFELWIRLNIPDKTLFSAVEQEYWNKITLSTRIDLNYLKNGSIKRVDNYDSKMSTDKKFVTWATKIKNVQPSNFQINKIKQLEEN